MTTRAGLTWRTGRGAQYFMRFATFLGIHRLDLFIPTVCSMHNQAPLKDQGTLLSADFLNHSIRAEHRDASGTGCGPREPSQ